VLAVLGLLALLGVISLFTALGIRARLNEARTDMAAGRAALLDGEAGEAHTAFEQALSSFLRARSQYRNPLTLALGYLPLIGRTPDAIGAIIEAGSKTAEAGRVVAGAAADLPGGAAALAPSGGQIPIEPLERVAPALVRARDLLLRAEQSVDDAPSGFLLPPVDEAADELGREVALASHGVTVAAAMTEALPAFLGADGERTYFVGAQNPAELRGTGGFMGAFAILTVDDGQIELGGFRTITALDSAEPGEVEAPNPGFAARYDAFGGATFWQNINMTPDFPSAAVAIERLYEHSEGEALDGVIAADPFALAEMIRATEPVPVPGAASPVAADDLVPFISNEAYAELTNPSARKRLLGDVAGEVLGRFLEGAVDPAAGGRALVEAAGGGHLLMHSTDPEVQASFEEAGVAGALPRRGDVVAVVANNAAGNKVDFYLEERVEVAVRLGAAGSATAATRVSLTNEAPDRGQPAYVIGPFDARFEPGENLTLLSTYCAPGCTLDRFDRSGGPDEVQPQTELGLPAFATLVSLPSGGSELLEYAWTYQDAWTGDDTEGRYRLTVRTQPTIRPTRLHVEVDVPAGMRVAGASPGMRVSGGRAIWEGDADTETTLELTFERPPLSRLWHEFLQVLR
jgi:hypothetical protein